MELPMRYRGVAAALAACSMTVALCSGGCATVSGIVTEDKKTSPRECTPVAAKNVVFHSRRQANDLEIIDLTGTMEGDVLKVQARLRISPRSKDQDMVPFMYSFYWFDAKGKEVAGEPRVWQPYIIYGRATVSIQGVAPDSRVRDFRLVIRGPDDSHC